jgi:aryl-alcohol dehydrogenase-like predicted oxidoreductase
MEHRALGASGLRVSEISYGTWINRSERQAAEGILAAIRHGITTFDTADVYGGSRSEAVLGAVVRKVRRESVVLCTKVCAPTGPGPNDRGLSRKHIMESAHASLRRLRTDYIDLYQAHRFDPQTPLVETLRAFDDLVRQGKVLYVGVSEWTAGQIAEALRIADDLGLHRIVANQPQYNMVWRVAESQVMPLCRREGVGQLVWSPLAQGLLSGKYRPGAAPPADSRAAGPAAAQFAAGGLAEEVLSRVARLAPLAAESGLSLPRLALAWALQNTAVASVITGASSPEQIAENAAASGVRLDAELLERVDEILDPVVERDPSRTPSQPFDYRRAAAAG